MSWDDNNTAMQTLADGTRVDTENLPSGMMLCTHCMHLHDPADVYTGPLSRDPVTGHWALLKAGLIECVSCRAHGPHPDMV